MTMSPRGGEHRCRLFLMQMSEEQIAKMTVSQIVELIKRLAEELEIRTMELI